MTITRTGRAGRAWLSLPVVALALSVVAACGSDAPPASQPQTRADSLSPATSSEPPEPTEDEEAASEPTEETTPEPSEEEPLAEEDTATADEPSDEEPVDAEETGAEDDAEQAAPDVTVIDLPAVEHTDWNPSSDPLGGSYYEGYLRKELGELSGIMSGDGDGSALATEFYVEDIRTGLTCADSDTVFAVLLTVRTLEEGHVAAPEGGWLRTWGEDFHVSSGNDEVSDGSDRIEGECVAGVDLLPQDIGAGELSRGWVVLDAQVDPAMVMLDIEPGSDSGWAWRVG